MKLSDFEGTYTEVWPDNWKLIEFYREYCATQWSVGLHGPVGLNYASVLAVLGSMVEDAGERKQLFADLRHIERKVLAIKARSASEGHG